MPKKKQEEKPAVTKAEPASKAKKSKATAAAPIPTAAKPTVDDASKRKYERSPDAIEVVKKALRDKKPHSFQDVVTATGANPNSVRSALDKLRETDIVLAEGPSKRATTYRLAA